MLLLGSEQFGVNVKADIVRRALRVRTAISPVALTVVQNNFSTVDQMIIEKEFIGPRGTITLECLS